MRKIIIPVIALYFLVGACNNSKTDSTVTARTEVKKYTAEQLYTNKSIGGVLCRHP